jgi:SAM-dependent methyltransferase
MLSKILPYLRCPRCLSTELCYELDGLGCRTCQSRYPVKKGILDMMGSHSDETITPFQRLMQTPGIVSIYEALWRRIGYFLASSRPFSREIETVLQLGKNRNISHALDVACGTGVFTRPLARQTGGFVVGIDMSWPMLTHAQQLMKNEGMRNILYVRATAFGLPFVDAAFPYVNCCGALHLFSRPDAALREIGRVLTPGGYLCVQTTIRPNRSAGLAYFLERFIRFGFFEEDKLREQMRVQGFTLVESERHRISFTFLARRNEMADGRA